MSVSNSFKDLKNQNAYIQGSVRGNPRSGRGNGQCPSFLLSNINRLITPSGHNKVGFLYDQAVNHNALFVGVTETWLHSGVLDAEVSHGFPGYSLYRTDRTGPDKVVVLLSILEST